MGKKYFAWSFDDGLEQDKKIIEILREFGLGATFHLNSGLFGDKTYEGRIGNLGMTEMPAEQYEAKARRLLPYVPHFRIPADEAVQVYAGFEIASHTCHHVNLIKCSEEERQAEIGEDVKALSALFGQPVTGFAYPYGNTNKKVKFLLNQCGVSYARGVRSTHSFDMPEDLLDISPTCRHKEDGIFDLAREFIALQPDSPKLFLLWGHSYEFDMQRGWERFERFCDLIAGHDDIFYATTAQTFLT